MFIVRWDGESPPDKEEWITVLREVLSSELGSYRLRFYPTEAGWRFDLDWRPEREAKGDAVIANSPESVRFNVYEALVRAGKPLDPASRS